MLKFAFLGVYGYTPYHHDGKRIFVPHMMGWQDFKKRLNFSKFTYCYRCGLPQDKLYCPSAHPDLSLGDKGKKKCPLEDFSVLFMWFIWHDENWWTRAVAAFPQLHFSMNAQAFGDWEKAGDSLHSFYNGLEMVLWFFSERDLEKRQT